MNITLAACTGTDPEVFYAQGGTYERRMALRICNGAPAKDGRPACPPCPVRDACLQAALRAEGLCDSGYVYGVVGGLTPQQRRKLVKPMCQRCEDTPRRWGTRYCTACAAEAHRATRDRFDRERQWSA